MEDCESVYYRGYNDGYITGLRDAKNSLTKESRELLWKIERAISQLREIEKVEGESKC